MFNSGLRGNRAPDGYGSVSNQAQFIQTKYPVPSITTFQVCNIGQYTPNGDTAADTAGNQTIVIIGTGFVNGCTLVLDNAFVSPVTFLSDDKIAFTSPAKASGTYAIYVSNPSGGTAILAPGLVYSGSPTFTTAAGSIGSYYETQNISNTIVATSDSAITYSLSAGSLPSGATFYANGAITGTAPVENNSNTYSFTVQATDAENQDAFRSFSLTINTDVVTWSSPADGTTYTSAANSAISNVTLSATSAAGYNVNYTANVLPANLTLTGNTISGTPNTVANTTTLLTATAATTGRSATRTINWVITVANDIYFPYATLLLSANASANTWALDASTNKYAVTINGDTRPVGFSPYNVNFSNYFDGTGDYLTIPNGSNTALGSGDFTVEVWLYATAVADARTAFSIGPTSGAIAMALYFGGTSTWQLSMYTPAGGVSFTSTAATLASYPALNAWSHHAIVRNGGNIFWYVNGVQVFTVANTVNFTQTGATVGYWASTAAWHGFISNFRIVVGTAVYTSAFTPPTSPLTAITNTRFLTCQSNRIIDNSTNNFAITKNGDVTVSSFGPFTETDTTTGSGYFDGSGDYISTSIAAHGTGNFTYECWVYITVHSALAGEWGVFQSSTTAGGLVTNYTSGVQIIRSGGVFNVNIAGTTYASNVTVQLNTWYHLAVVRNSGTISFYINGVNSITSATNNTNFSATNIAIGGYYNTSYLMTGYVSDFRVVNSAVYTGNFTPPTNSLTAVANTSLLLLQYRLGENNSRFVDSSGNYFPITRNGNTTQGTFSPFSQTGWSNYFDGTGDSLSWSGTVIGSGAFSVEFWIYSTNGYGAMRAPIGVAGIGSTNAFEVRIDSATVIQIGKYNVSLTSFTVPTLLANTWYHVVLCRNASNQATVFVNGTRSSTGAISFSLDFPAATSRIGQLDGGANAGEVTGYISNVRIVVGSTPYDPTQSTISVPTSKLTAISNTQLLTCQDNRFKDNSTNNFTITRNNDTSVQAYGPFSPSESYSVTTVGGSGYFDGTGDYLYAGNNIAFTMGTADFTYECWVYHTSITGQQTYFARTNGNFAGVYFYKDASNFPGVYYTAQIATSSVAITAGQWYHLVTSRLSGTLRIFVNGVQTASVANSTNLTESVCYVGGDSNATNPVIGYMAGCRIQKGKGISSVTVPTTPVSSTTNTSLLLNFTNGSIIDATGKNGLETVGDTKISTVQSKFNGSSIYFDGTGDWLYSPVNVAQWSLQGDFTIEFWIYFNSQLPVNDIVGTANNSSYLGAGKSGWIVSYKTASGISFAWQSSNSWQVDQAFASTSISTSTWTYVAVVRSGSTIKCYLNGTASASTATNSSNLTSSDFGVYVGAGAGNQSSTIINAYVADLRITKYARYTSNFTAPTTAFPAF